MCFSYDQKLEVVKLKAVTLHKIQKSGQTQTLGTYNQTEKQWGK